VESRTLARAQWAWRSRPHIACIPRMVGAALMACPIIALAAAVPANADDLWIAVAVSQSSGESVTQTGYTNVLAAQHAINDCNRIGHVDDCEWIASGHGGCVATATSGRPYSIKGAWAANREAAASAALAQAAAGSHVAVDCIGDPGFRKK
jgi:Domain of unknown function (DUF4189)